jgi:hypothetical protein
MIKISNPFAESTLTEHIAAEDFVTIFSPVILEEASALFHQGNVVLAGTPGTGKSMLLALLKPETRIAYFRARADFPVTQPEQRKFISAGINLTKAGAQDFGHRLAVDGIAGEKPIDLTLFFADFFNYYLVFDLLKNLETYLDETLNPLQTEKGLNISKQALDHVATKISSASCWFEYLEGIANFSELIKAIDRRLTAYRSYFNFNTDDLSDDIRTSKTAIGEPIATVVSILRAERIIDSDTSVFIRVDQVEELYHLEAQYGLGSNYRQIINKALAMRDKRVSYRLGMRHYALEAETHVFGTASRLEEERDFFIINLDNVLKRVENQKNWRFPTLANDIFARRLESAGYIPNKDSAVRDVFGVPMPRDELAIKYAGKATDRILDLDPEWPTEWKEFLRSLAAERPLSAKFGEAWARQRGKSSVTVNIPDKEELPWAQKRWWVKERNEHALMLIASKAGQRLIWSGDIDLYELSGGNVHVFIAVCRHIWQAWLRSESGNTMTRQLPKIDFSIQATGVYDASRSWFEKVIPHGFNGSSRQRIVRELGEWMAKKMATDKAMSNPGHNGFSITAEELADDIELSNWLNLATGFGDLVSAPHTTKLKDRKLRRKWYLNPILSPYFRIPHVHTKEPIYTSTAELRKILSVTSLIGEVKVQKKPVSKAPSNDDAGQLNLFSENQK